jgi:radical SAM superfamily enzyme YgiQ (UPF0313 family)
MRPAIISAVIPSDWEKEFCLEYFEDINYNTDAPLIGMFSQGFDINHLREVVLEFKKRGKTVIMVSDRDNFSEKILGSVCDSVVHGHPNKNDMINILEDARNNRLSKRYLVDVNIDFPFDYSVLKDRPLGYIPVISSLGCHYHCEYCCHMWMYKSHYYLRSLKNILADLHTAQKIKKLIGFLDANIYNDRDHLKGLCQGILEENLKILWGAQSTIDIGDDAEMLDLMKLSGCRVLFIGLETLSQINLNKLNKPFQAQSYFERVKKIRKKGIYVVAYFMIGFDEDDRNTFEDLYEFIQLAHIDLPIINLLIPVPGTTIFKRFQNEGRLFIEDEKEFIEKSPLYSVPNNHCLFTPKNMTAQEAETYYLRLVSRVSTLPAILRRSLLPNPLMAVISFIINYYFRTEYKIMAKSS